MLLRPDQQKALEELQSFFASAQPGDKKLFVAPTGWGKSYVQAKALMDDPGLYLLTPRQEIVYGILTKLGHNPAGLSAAKFNALAESQRIWTPKRLLNRLEDAAVESSKRLLVDECFPAETLVSGKPISTYVPGDGLRTAFGTETVIRTFRHTSSELVRISFQRGQNVRCTRNHPFFTDIGWVPAEQLEGRRVLRVRTTDSSETTSSQDRPGGSRSSVGCGDRRLVSLQPQGTGTGSSEGCVLEWVWVDSVEVHQPGSDDGLGACEVFNLEVSPSHTYLVGSDGWVVHNCHHHNAQTYQDIDLLMDRLPGAGFTATPYRGTPKGTADLIARWGQPHWLMRYPEAVAAGIIRMPSVKVVPLVDDDVITVANGEFVIRAASDLIRSRAEALVELASDNPNRLPTMMSLPSVEACHLVAAAAKAAGLPVDIVTGETCTEDRQRAFDRCIKAQSVLLQIFVVSEGVDLPIRRLIDARPTMSPVVFMQTLGRVMRPGDVEPEYLCCCRNIERFCYLLDGLVPSPVIKEAQMAFGKPSDRTVIRAIGFEAVGRFKATELPLKDGLKGHMYGLTAVDGIHCVQWAVLLHPAKADPIVAARKLTKTLDGTYDYNAKDAKWVPAELPDNMTGFASSAAGTLSPAMKDWWSKSAGAFGLDPHTIPNRRSFVALPILAQLKERM